MDTTTDGLVTRSAARAKRIIIFYLFPLSNVDEDACVVFVWWLMELPSHQLPLQKCLLTLLSLFLRLLHLEVKWSSLGFTVLRPSCIASVVASS